MLNNRKGGREIPKYILNLKSNFKKIYIRGEGKLFFTEKQQLINKRCAKKSPTITITNTCNNH